MVFVNPEDDPEGFKKLRQAYEGALEFAQREEEEVQEQEDHSPLGQWMKKVEDVYFSISERTNVSCWQALLQEEVCLSLDDSNAAIESLLSFMRNHYRLPSEVWLLLGKTFQFDKNKDELYELFPPEFIDYVINNSENGDWFDYTLFEGEDKADYDAFLYEYHEIRSRLNEEKIENLEENFDKIKAYSIHHPYLEIEKIRLLIFEKNLEAIKAIISELDTRYPEDDYIGYYSALAKWEMGEYEAAFKDFNKLLERVPNHYSAKKKIAEYYLKTADYNKAKEESEALLDSYSSDEEALALLRAANDYIIKQLEEHCAVDKENISRLMELGWCLFQNERYEEVITSVKEVEPENEDDRFDYPNLLGRAYYYSGKYEQALQHLKKWKDNIEKIKDDTEKSEHRKSRWGYAVLLIGYCYKRLSEDVEDKTEYLEKALTYSEEALSSQYVDNKLDFFRQKADVLLKLDRNEECIDVCQNILEKDDQYVAAYIYRQEAYYNLRYSQEVIDDYYRIIEIVPQYAKAYIFAIEVFYGYNQLEDATEVIDRAKEAQVISQQLQLLFIKIQRRNAENDEKTSQVIEWCETLKTEVGQEESDIEDRSEIYAQEALCYMDLKEYEQANREINSAVDINPSNPWYHKLKGNVLGLQENYEEAIKVLQLLTEQYPQYEDAYYDMAYYYEKLKEDDEAICQYKKLLEINHEHTTVNNKLRALYQKKYLYSFDCQDFELAKNYADSHIGVVSTAQSYMDRGILYFEAYQLDLAEADFHKVIELNVESIYAYDWLGDVYKILEQYDKALEMYKKAVEKLGEKKEYHPHMDLGECYELMKEYDKAVAEYLYVLEMYPEDERCYKNIARAFKTAYRYEEAMVYYNKIIELSNVDTETAADAMGEIAKCYENLGDYTKAKETYQKGLEKFKMEGRPCLDLSSYYYRVEKDYIKAIQYNEQAMDILEKNGDRYLDYTDCCEAMMGIYDDLGHKNQVKKYSDLYEKCLVSNYDDEETYLKNIRYQKIRLYTVCVKYIYANELIKAEQIFKRMQETKKCSHCVERKCVEEYVIMAMFCEKKGDYKKAIEYYDRVIKEGFEVEIYSVKIQDLKDNL